MTSIMLPLPVAEDAIKRPYDQIKHIWLSFNDPAAVVPVFMRYCYYNAIPRTVSRHTCENIAKKRYPVMIRAVYNGITLDYTKFQILSRIFQNVFFVLS